MFVLSMHFSTIIYIIIFVLLIIIASINFVLHWKQRDRIYYLRFLLLSIVGLIYNFIEEIFPDSKSTIDRNTQYIISYTSGLLSAFYFLFYLYKEYHLKFIKRFDLLLVGSFSFLILICSFIIPLSITKSISIPRYLFLSIILIILLLNIFSILKNQFLKFKSSKEIFLKVHSIIGVIGFLSIISLPITILASSGNQFIVQFCYTLGFFIISTDYFLYPYRKQEIKKTISFEKLSVRETEVLKLLLEDPNLKYSEISQMLNISEKTLSTHLSNIYKKIEIKNKKEIHEISKIYKSTIIE